MSSEMKLIMESWNKFLNEGEQVEEGLGDMFRQIGRSMTGAMSSAKDMRNLVSRIERYNTGVPDEWFDRHAENLIGTLKAHAVEWFNRDAGPRDPVRGVDPDEFERILRAYRKNPARHHDEFISAMRNLRKALDAYIQGA